MRSSNLQKYLLLFFIYLFCASTISPQSVDSVGDESSELKASLHLPKFSNIPRVMSEYSQVDEFNPFRSKINYPVLAGMGAAFLGTGTAIHLYQQKAWWSDQRTEFHFQDDWGYALWIDKIGHAYGAMLIQHGISAGLEAANLEAEQCVWYGSLAALSFQTFIEIEDGFGPQWGFSPGDFYGDVFGSAYPLLQYYVPFSKILCSKQAIGRKI